MVSKFMPRHLLDMIKKERVRERESRTEREKKTEKRVRKKERVKEKNIGNKDREKEKGAVYK